MAKKKAPTKKAAGKRDATKSTPSAGATVTRPTTLVHKFAGLQAPLHVCHEVHGGEACCTALRFCEGTSNAPGAINLAPGSDYEVRYIVDPKRRSWSLQIVQTPAAATLQGGAARDMGTPLPPPLPQPPPPPSPLPPTPPGYCFCLESGLSRVCEIDEAPLCTSNTIDCILQPNVLAAPTAELRGKRGSATPKAKGKKTR